MHFLHVIQRYYPYTGGSELYFQEFSEQLAADGHQVTVLTTDAWDLDHFWAAGRKTIDERETILNGVRIKRFPVTRLPGPPIAYPILRRLMVELGRLPGSTPLLKRMALLTPRVPELSRYLATTTEHFDLVHTTNITLDFTILPALNFARRRSIPHLCTPFVHLGEPGKQQILRYYTQRHQLAILRESKRVMVQTTLEGDELRRLGVPDERLRLIGCWVRPTALVGGVAERFRQEHHLHGPIVLSIGAAAYDKGTMHTIAAMRQLWEHGSDATLVLIAGTTLAQFEQFYAALPESIKGRILLLRAAPHQTKLDALAAADVYVMPSRTDSFGIVYLEAWIYDLPVIGARAGGVPAVIDHEQNGLLVDFGDVAALAREIQRLLSDRELALTFDRQYAKIRSVYADVTGQAL
jgi:glycogen synthase